MQLNPNFKPDLDDQGRLDRYIFDTTGPDYRLGEYADQYFNVARDILVNEGMGGDVATMQLFQKKDSILCGVDEVIAHIINNAGLDDGRDNFNSSMSHYSEGKQFEIQALRDGAKIAPWETVMLIKGPYAEFAPLETTYLGIMARQTNIATNVRAVVDAADGLPVYYFAARFDHPATQPGDGYAAMIGGASGVSTNQQASYWNGQGIGTVPHALIAMFNGDTVQAALAYRRLYPNLPLTILVDYRNDCVNTAIAVAKALEGDRLTVRLDTSEKLVDASLERYRGLYDEDMLRGVSANLVGAVRSGLDAEGFHNVGINVSGGFNTKKIKEFRRTGVPINSLGVGASLLEGSTNFTADIVEVNGEPQSKVGRQLNPNDKLEKVYVPGEPKITVDQLIRSMKGRA